LILEGLIMSNIKYPFTVRPLSEEGGGGYLAEFPDLPGCIADGDTVEEAIEQASDALESWFITARENNDPIPAPSIPENFSIRGINYLTYFGLSE
jgi:antitoxin HicB